jgi:hypothetical protein
MTTGCHRHPAVLAAALATTLVLAACGGENDEPTGGESSDEGQSRGAGSLTEVSPLTGQPISDAPAHPVMVVKIDNTASAAPQVGLSGADLVVEELVEGGSTRYAAFYWETKPRQVGPVRSMRATDIGIAQPAEALLIAAGGAPKTRRRIKASGIALREENDPGFSRDGGREAPYNLMVDLEELADSLDDVDPPLPYLPFGPAGEWPGGKPATSIEAAFSGVHTTTWRFEEGTGWIRPDSLAEQGDDFVPDSVLVMQVRQGDAGYLDPAGNPVPEFKVVGEGDATLFHAGEAVEARWSKASTDAPIELTTSHGEDLSVPVGATWIELVPQKTGSVTYGG